jgi:hypothetical protein
MAGVGKCSLLQVVLLQSHGPVCQQQHHAIKVNTQTSWMLLDVRSCTMHDKHSPAACPWLLSRGRWGAGGELAWPPRGSRNRTAAIACGCRFTYE